MAADEKLSGSGAHAVCSNAALTPDDLAAMPGVTPGEYILVFVSDTGAGMEAPTLARAFEPFFTTKDVGKGTGLGLSQVYGFVKQAAGHVRIESEVGRGTTVRLYLPRSIEQATSLRVDASPLRRAEDGEVILVVEDEPSVLEVAVESLTELGYKTVSASNAQAALDVLRGAERVDILFSDVVMPGGMNGVQLTVEARRLRPDLRVVLASGYVGSGVGEGDLPEGVPLLTKPYRREDLAKTLSVLVARR